MIKLLALLLLLNRLLRVALGVTEISKPNERAEKESIRTTNSKRFKNQNAPNDPKFL